MAFAEAVRLNGTAVVVSELLCSSSVSQPSQLPNPQLKDCAVVLREDMTKARLDCYDEIVPPVIEDCRLVKQDEQRLTCFN